MTYRVRLRPVKAGDLPQIEPWYAEALAAAYTERSLEQRFADAKTAGCDLLAIAGGDGAVRGLLDYRLNDPADGWLTTVLIAMAAGQRGWGYGSEAMRLLESRHRNARFHARIDPRNGLALYFWLRLGYRPARPDEVFWRVPNDGGIIAMIRDSGSHPG